MSRYASFISTILIFISIISCTRNAVTGRNQLKLLSDAEVQTKLYEGLKKVLPANISYEQFVAKHVQSTTTVQPSISAHKETQMSSYTQRVS